MAFWLWLSVSVNNHATQIQEMLITQLCKRAGISEQWMHLLYSTCSWRIMYNVQVATNIIQWRLQIMITAVTIITAIWVMLQWWSVALWFVVPYVLSKAAALWGLTFKTVFIIAKNGNYVHCHFKKIVTQNCQLWITESHNQFVLFILIKRVFIAKFGFSWAPFVTEFPIRGLPHTSSRLPTSNLYKLLTWNFYCTAY